MTNKINVAYLTISASESVNIRGFVDIEFTNSHVIFYMNETNRNMLVAYRNDRIVEIQTAIEE